jgi:hypothetical protein
MMVGGLAPVTSGTITVDGSPTVGTSRSAGRRLPDHRSADCSEAPAANRKSGGLTALPIPPLLWPIY